MFYFTQCPIPTSSNGDCFKEPHPAAPFGVCIEHWKELVASWHEEQPAVNIRCVHCSYLNIVDSVEIPTARCTHCTLPIEDIEEAQAFIQAEREAHEASYSRGGVVYYIKFGNRIKIGFTRDLAKRLTAIPNDEVLAAEPGTFELEAQRHAEFKNYQIKGEWFSLSNELLLRIAGIRKMHGDPFKVKVSEVARC